MRRRQRPPKSAAAAARTLGQVATHFRVAERTVAYWRARGMPGRPGAYDLSAIAAWRDQQALSRSAPSEAGEELAQLEVELKQLKLQRERGGIVSIDLVARLFSRHIHEAKVQLDQLPDEILAELGDAVPREQLAALRERIRGRIDGTCQSLADLLTSELLDQEPAGPAAED